MKYSLEAFLLIATCLISYTSCQYGPTTLNNSCSCPGVEELITHSEEKRYCMYIDQIGIPTVGIGFNLNRPDAPDLIRQLGLDYYSVRSGAICLTDDQVMQLFRYDLNWATEGAKNCVPSFYSHPPCIQTILIDLTFNLGKIGFCGWGYFIRAIEGSNYVGAANHMVNLHKEWCRVRQMRCTKNSDILRSCH